MIKRQLKKCFFSSQVYFVVPTFISDTSPLYLIKALWLLQEQRERELGFVPQRDIVFNNLLPYKSELDGNYFSSRKPIKKSVTF